MEDIKTEEAKKTIDNLKAHFKQGLDKSGDFVYFEITINEDLKKMLKQAVINETATTLDLRTGTEEDGTDKYESYERYKVKRVIYNVLYENAEYLFIKKLLDSGKFKFKFLDLSRLENFKGHFKRNIQKTLTTLLGIELEQTVTFKQQ
jgi:hypothetical protein